MISSKFNKQVELALIPNYRSEQKKSHVQREPTSHIAQPTFHLRCIAGEEEKKINGAHLLFLLCNLYSHILVKNKASDSFVSLGWIDVGKDEEDFRFTRVGDPPVRTRQW